MTDAQAGREFHASTRRLMRVIALAIAGLAVSAVAQGIFGLSVRGWADSLFYGKCISVILTVGLFASTYGISRRELTRNARVVLVAVTLGVALKAGLVGGIMALAYGSIGFVLLGVAVAQIDPLSVAASLRHSGMSDRAKSILSAWACFDDPVTILLVYLGSYTLPVERKGAQGSLAVSAGSYLSQIVLNAALVAAAAVTWYLLTTAGRNRLSPRTRSVLQCLVLVGLLAVAASYGLLIGITVCGLFFHPPIEAARDRVVDFAFYAATFLLGLLLVEGVNVPAGILLGASVFAVQALVALGVGSGLPRADRVHLALGQQNGLTAIVLALALQPYLPQAVGVIAIAILTVNVIHISANRRWELKSRALVKPQVPVVVGLKSEGSVRPVTGSVARPARVPDVAERSCS